MLVLRMTAPILPPLRPVLRPLVAAIAPLADEFAAADWAAAEQLIEDALGEQPAAEVARFARFVRVIGWLAIITTGRSVGHLPPARRRRLLERLAGLPVPPVGRRVERLRRLALLGVWGRVSARTVADWRPDPRGWAARGPGDQVRRTPRPTPTALTLVK